MPCRARIRLERSVIVSKLLPFGPLLMVKECGGAEWTKCKSAQISTAQMSTMGPTVCTKAHSEMFPFLDGMRFWSPITTHDAANDGGHHARPPEPLPAPGPALTGGSVLRYK